ncbi:hypothetical protein [Massilia endophytica]|uniref:hypothetical protein n=1 Tax=Massilia endophytica TaxID=2899220 RepID=UPI001E488A4A|nr:hypothetical protein [Massilia endophytica]UGQ44985.1 hypothetical protein LSQ66_14380 [Massilia endophytica]
MKYPPSLTKAELLEIQARRSADDVLRLLWEIARLRRRIMKARQIAHMIYGKNDALGMLAEQFRKDLEEEAVVAEWNAEWAGRHPKGEENS